MSGIAVGPQVQQLPALSLLPLQNGEDVGDNSSEAADVLRSTQASLSTSPKDPNTFSFFL